MRKFVKFISIVFILMIVFSAFSVPVHADSNIYADISKFELITNKCSKYVTLLSQNVFNNALANRDQIRYLQKELNSVMGYELDTDGKFGPLTQNSVKGFQAAYGLEVDGKVGPLTRAALNNEYLARKLIVKASKLNIRNNPGTTGTTILGSLKKGDIVKILDDSAIVGNNKWYKISYNGIVGYVCGRQSYVSEKFIEVDIVSQTLRLYIDGNLYLDTAITTGKYGTRYETEKGFFTVMFVDTDRILKPSNCHVDYWMRFNDPKSQGIHDANWRGYAENFKYFGGTVYKQNGNAGTKYSGSKGCVNIPPVKMPIIFQNTGYGTIVYVH